MSNSSIVNKGISMCFIKMAKIDGSVAEEELKSIKSSKIYNKYKHGNIKDLDSKGFFQKFHSEYGPAISKALKEKEKENLITDLINVIKADDDIHKHEYFLLGHIGNCIGLDSKKIVNIIELENKGSKKSTGWLAWLFG